MDDLGIPDPQWDFTLVIRSALQHDGRFVFELDDRDAQARVDLHWAARQAGRLLGVEVEIDLSPPYGRAGSTVTATVRCIEIDASARARAEDGLRRLLASVQEAQAMSFSPAVLK
jgi:hypothetical protein